LHAAVIFLFLASFISLVLAVYSFHFRHSQGIMNFNLLMLCVTIYSFAYALELNSNTLAEALFWNKIEYFGISCIPAFFLLFVLRYTHNDAWLGNKTIPLFFVIPAITLVMHWNTSQHGLFYHNVHLEPMVGLSVLVFERGFFYWLHIVYINIALLAGFIILFFSYRESQGYFRRQLKMLFLGVALPWIVFIFYIAGIGPKGIDLNPFGFMLMGLVIGYGLFFQQFLEITPVAFSAIFRNMREGVIIFDAGKRITGFNPALTQYFPFIKEQWIGVSAANLPVILNPLKNLLENPAIDEIEFPCELNSGRKYFHAAISLLFDNRSRPQGYAIILFDITARKEAEEKLEESEKRLAQLNVTKDRILSVIAHDLRNPFNQVIGFSEVLLAQAGKYSEEKTREILGYIHVTSLKASQLLENLLQWVGAQTGRFSFVPEPVDINILLKENIAMLGGAAAGKNIRLVYSSGEQGIVFADRNMLEVIIRNLLSNALKFTGSGGMIETGCSSDDDGITVYVKDTGTGISQEQAERLFTQPLNETTKGTMGEKGSGMGLALCKEFVEQHHGRIWVESIPGKGSTFFFWLPKR